jgi:exosortase
VSIAANTQSSESDSSTVKYDLATILPFVVAVALLAALALPILQVWYYEYTKPESYYAHAPMIPFICGLMFWYKRDAIAKIAKGPDYRALPFIALFLGLMIFAIDEELEAVRSMALLSVVTCSIWFTLGPKFVRLMAFPIAFLWLMSPLPGPVLNDCTLRLQMFSTQFAAAILKALTFQAVRVGNVINMENFSLFVDVPCSGFKLFLSYLTFSSAFAYLVDGPPSKRVMLFLITIPLSLVVNAVRIALIGLVGDLISADAAKVFHDWSGMITLVLGFVVLFSLAKAFGCRKFAGWDIF